ncbi:hypothetical protein AJ79_04385 [Helicocarpus griseus UAMH5409]|uniref:Geranylgeranyl pyrophosphate synthase n=1 Tax=Helicocarpus griseus UAMH5409 TaxID=1447875 RepID=A0A2B7XTM8_9EURO|nr:hypothetical protein AJ79_04385 [Helicocarpus griseus UAMH5409]
MEIEFTKVKFDNSDPGDPGYDPPAGYFNTLPYRTSRFRDDTVNNATAYIRASYGEDRLARSAITERGHLTSWILPELPNGLTKPTSEFVETSFYLDDIGELLEAAQYIQYSADVQLALTSYVKLGEPDVENDGVLNPLGQFLRGCPGEFKAVLQKMIPRLESIWDSHIALTRRMPFEEYKDYKMKTFNGRFFSKLILSSHDLDVSDIEIASVAHLIDSGSRTMVLTNDYYGFYQEFDEVFKSGDLNKLRNAICVLMRDYGYSEDEAFHILKQEILREEVQLLSEYKAWELSSTTKSDALQRFVALWILACGGLNYWTSFSPRYRTAVSTTKADRAQLTANCSHPVRTLLDYPPPQISQNEASSATQKEISLIVETKQAVTTNGQSNGDKNQGLETFARWTDFLVPLNNLPEDICTAPLEYIRSLSGKKTLPKFAAALNQWFKLPAPCMERLEEVIAIYCDAIMMLDDIEDYSELRRGRPAAHILYGPSQTFNSATYATVEVMKLLAQGERESLGVCLELEEFQRMFHGQALELYWRHHQRCPTIDEYITMIDGKSAGIFRLIYRLMEAEAKIELADSGLLRLMTLLARYFQIRDDYQNLADAKYASAKGFCDDLSEGKFSLPLIHFLNHSPAADRVRTLIFNRQAGSGLSFELKKWILSEMESAGSIEYVADILKSLHAEALRLFEGVEAKLGRNSRLKMMVIATHI